VLEALQWKGVLQGVPLVHIVENRSGIITVAADGAVYGNALYDGASILTSRTTPRHRAALCFEPVSSGTARRADDRFVFRLMGPSHR